MAEQKMALARLRSALANHSATISSAGTSLRLISDRLTNVWETLNNTKVGRLTIKHFQ